MRRSEKTGTPVPRRDLEREARGYGEVTTYQLTPEELAEIRAKYPATPRDKAFKTPIEIKTKPKEDKNMSGRPERQGPSCGLTKEVFLEQIAAGETVSSIEKAWGMKYNTLTYWVSKWDLKGITADKARELLEGGDKQEEPLLREKDVAERPSPVEELLDKAEREIERLTAERDKLAGEVERLQGRVVETVALSGQASEHLQAEMDKLREANNLIKAEVERLTEERDDYLHAIEDLESKAADYDGLALQLDRTKRQLTADQTKLGDLVIRIAELELELEQAEARQAPVMATVINDTVNHPAHYTAGAIECIDAIEAATAQLTGKEAFATGQVIKYLWRWRLKGGVEDLRKVQWYLQRLIEAVK